MIISCQKEKVHYRQSTEFGGHVIGDALNIKPRKRKRKND